MPEETLGVETTEAATPTTETSTETTETGVTTAVAGQEDKVEQAFAKRLAQERQKFEQEYSPYRNLIAEAAKEHGMTPEQYVEAVREQQEQAKLQAEAEKAGVNPEIYQKLNSMEQELAKYRQQNTLTEQEATLAESPFFKEWAPELKQVANQYGCDLQTAYTMMAGDKLPSILQSYEDKLKTAKEDAVKEYLAQKRQPSGVVEGTGPTPVIEAQPPKTFDDAKKNSLAFLRAAMKKE